MEVILDTGPIFRLIEGCLGIIGVEWLDLKTGEATALLHGGNTIMRRPKGCIILPVLEGSDSVVGSSEKVRSCKTFQVPPELEALPERYSIYEQKRITIVTYEHINKGTA